MPVVSILGDIQKGRAGRYAVPLFNTFDSWGTEGILAAAAKKHAPVILGVYSGLFDKPEAGPFMTYLRAMAAQAPFNVSIMLDHGGSFEHCIKAIMLGCTDIMFDGSKLPVAENIAITRRVVEAAHAVGVAVEAELGHVGQGSEYQTFGALGKGFTDPAQVKQFVAETGVDSLAVAVGTAHGKFQGEPKLDLALLARLREATMAPLAIHGGSGVPEAMFRAAVAAGACKINIFTDLATAAVACVGEECKSPDATFLSIGAKIRQGFQERAEYHLDLFGTSGKA